MNKIIVLLCQVGIIMSQQTNSTVCPQSELKLDIIFVLDVSLSVKNYFGHIKSWTTNMSAKFDIKTGNTQIGVVVYSNFDGNKNYIKTKVRLGQYTNTPALQRAISTIPRPGASPYTAHAINKTVLDFENGSRWLDRSTAKVMVVLTDGGTSDIDQLPASAEYARSLGIIPFAVGIGSDSERELHVIATGNESSNLRVVIVESFRDLNDIVDELYEQIIDVASKINSNCTESLNMTSHAETTTNRHKTNAIGGGSSDLTRQPETTRDRNAIIPDAQEAGSTSASLISMIAGSGLLALILVGAAVCGFVYWRKRQKPRTESDTEMISPYHVTSPYYMTVESLTPSSTTTQVTSSNDPDYIEPYYVPIIHDSSAIATEPIYMEPNLALSFDNQVYEESSERIESGYLRPIHRHFIDGEFGYQVYTEDANSRNSEYLNVT